MIGKTISHYKIIEKLGEGGMGVVYKAEDLNLERFVALKFLPPHIGVDEEEKQRFIHEAKAASALDHPNICTIYEINLTETGQLFICMAYYQGQMLRKKMEHGPLKIEEAIDISMQVGRGLANAHEKNVIHRDIKSANILITSDGIAKILDFGLAKLAGQSKLTKETTTLGTIAYMSPEQAKGEEVDHRTDIWSLGVLIHEMISGQVPFKGDYEKAVIYSILNESPQPLTALRTGVPMELEQIVNKCLEKNPDDRYQHIDDIIVDLRRLKKDSEAKITPTKEVVGIKSLKKSNKPVLFSVILLSIVLIVVFGYFLIDRISSTDSKTVAETQWENSIAVLPFENISNDPEQNYFCDGMTEQIITNLSKLGRLKVIARTSVMTYKNTNKQIPEIGKELDVAHILEGSIRKYGNNIRITAQLINTTDGSHLWAEDYDRELENIFKIQDDISEKISRELLQKLSKEDMEVVKSSKPKNVEAWQYYLKGKYFHLNKFLGATSSIDDFKTSELMLKKAIELDPDYAPSYAALADLYNTYYNNLAEKEEERVKYLKLQEKFINEAYKLDQNSAEVLDVKGWVYEARGEIEKAYNSYKKAHSIQPNLWEINFSLGVFYLTRGLVELSNKYITRAIELDPVLPDSYNLRARCYSMSGEPEKAEIDLQKALEINPNHRGALYNYSMLLIMQKNYNTAEKMIAIREKTYPETESNQYLRAFLLSAHGEKEKALEVDMDLFNKFILYSILKMKEEVILYLNEDFERIKNSQESWYIWFINSPLYEFLRSDPRFQEILAKHKKLFEENLAKYGEL